MDGKVGLSVGYATILVQPEIFALIILHSRSPKDEAY